MRNKYLLFFLVLFLLAGGFALGLVFPMNNKIGKSASMHEVKDEGKNPKAAGYEYPKAKNIIFLIGDGMGTTQVYTAITANHNQANFERFKHIGFSKTTSSDSYITDSAAGATAFSIGQKSFNGAIGVNQDSVPMKTILEMAEEQGLATGLISTSSITHATPASFIGHQVSRQMQEEIADNFLETDVDVFIGGGQVFFNAREDGNDLIADLRNNGYDVAMTVEEVKKSKGKKLAGLLAEDGMPPASERGDMLSVSTKKALGILEKNKKGFFLMVEGSQIDWSGHANDPQWLLDEMQDFDQVLGEVLDYAKKDGNTLVVVTADHETGGLALDGGSLEDGTIEAHYSSAKHTGVMVPVFAYGPGAELFQGIYENNTIFNKMLTAYRMENTQKK